MLEKAPFHPKSGDLMGYVGGAKVVWRDNTPFRARLLLVGIHRGQSSALFHWRDERSHLWPMFMSSTAELMTIGRVDQGFAEGWWRVVKIGGNYGVHPIKPPKEGP